MVKRTLVTAPSPQLMIDSPPDSEFMYIGEFTFCCKYHPDEIEWLTKAQLTVINQYPVPRQIFRDTDLYNRKLRRQKKR